MSFIKATKDIVCVVCSCGATNERGYSEAILTRGGVQFPPCEACGGTVSTGMAVPEFSEAFPNLKDDQIKRLVIAQIVHKRALENPESHVVGIQREALIVMAEARGLHYFVQNERDIYEAPSSPGNGVRTQIL